MRRKKIFHKKSVKSIKKRIGFIVLSFSILLITSSIVYQQQSRKVAMEPLNNLGKYRNNIQIPTSTPTDTPTPIPTIPILPRYDPQPHTTFNISTWKTYENSDVGLRFKYPSEWGDVESDLWNHCDISYITTKGECEHEVIGRIFNAKFTGNSLIDFGGVADHWTEGTDPGITKGFGGYHGRDPLSFCSIHGDSWFCQVTGNFLHTVIMDGSYAGYSLHRVLFVNAPNNRIKGFGFSGGFLSKRFNNYIEGLKTYYIADPNYIIPENALEPLRNATLERRLDPESMRNFDMIEKIYETVEVF
jgi:hypothetical protein